MPTEISDTDDMGDSPDRPLSAARRPIGLVLATAVALAAIVFWTTAPVAQRVRSTGDVDDQAVGEASTTTAPSNGATVSVVPSPEQDTGLSQDVGVDGDGDSSADAESDSGPDEGSDTTSGADTGVEPDPDADPGAASSPDQLPMSTTDQPTTSTIAADNTTSGPTTTAPGNSTPVAVDVQTDVTPIPILDPRDFGGRGDGVTDDTSALERTIEAAGDLGGGIVLIADGVTYRTTDFIVINDDHVRLWARSGRGAILADTGGERTSQAIICQDNDGCGVHGVRFRSTATRRLSAREDSQIVLDGATNAEVVGNEIEGSASAAIFVYGRSSGTHIEGNYVHDSWSDSVHFTGGSRRAWVWDNTFYTPTPGKGDDGIACVTYGDGSRCRQMEWWANTHLGSGWGRAFAVVGGEQIEIHHNYAHNIAGAGVLVASEPSYDTPGSTSISIHNNTLIATGRVVPHSGILVSGLSAPITDVDIRNNLVVDYVTDEPTRIEGDVQSIDVSATSTSADQVPQPAPSPADAAAKPTDTLKLRDRSFVDSAYRPGLHRLLVSMSNGTSEQRYEYVLAGQPALVDSWASEIGAGSVAARSTVGGDQISVVVSPVPARLPAGAREVGFAELRRLDVTGSAPQIWAHLNR